MPDLLIELRDYFDTIAPPVDEEQVARHISGRQAALGPQARAGFARQGWVVALAAAVAVLVLVGGVTLLTRSLGGEAEPAAPSERRLLDVEFGDIPPFRLTYPETYDPEEAPSMIEVSYAGLGREFRLETFNGRCGGEISIWDGEWSGTFSECEQNDEWIVEPASPDFEPLGYLGWQIPWLRDGRSWQDFCQSVQTEQLPEEVIAGRPAVGVRCIASRDDFRLWVDAETGLVLRLAGSRGEGTWPTDFEITAIEYNPAFAADTFLIPEAPASSESVEEEPSADCCPETGISQQSSSQSVNAFGLEAGHIVPPYSGRLLDGGSFDLADLRGQPVLLMLWSDWCDPCVDSLDPFREVATEWKDRVAFVSILTLDSTPEFATEIVRELDLTLPVVIDENDTLWYSPDAHTALGEEGRLFYSIPSYLLIDAEGRAIGAYLGSASQEDLNQLLNLFE